MAAALSFLPLEKKTLLILLQKHQLEEKLSW